MIGEDTAHRGAFSKWQEEIPRPPRTEHGTAARIFLSAVPGCKSARKGVCNSRRSDQREEPVPPELPLDMPPDDAPEPLVPDAPDELAPEAPEP
ncbi:hypothetical protein [Noviherbaspirillum humi]|uniref:hypothetical protein n=1 Tax=Noviherbaspirillum humi TaxID=1688639 RepID=UPI0011607E32|nr:hypothetical protein [Noviherbaspirillum humi]